MRAGARDALSVCREPGASDTLSIQASPKSNESGGFILEDPLEHKLKVLVVGQTPPPINGQTLMIESFLAGVYPKMTLFHVRMKFSRNLQEVGSFSWKKVWLLVVLIADIVVMRIRSGATVLFYPPAEPSFVPVFRDILTLLCVRWLFRKTVFHFHAVGLTEIYSKLPRLLRPLFRAAYSHPDLVILPTQGALASVRDLKPTNLAVVHNGISDIGIHLPRAYRGGRNSPPAIFYIGLLCEGKGILVLIEACALLKAKGHLFTVSCAGAFESPRFEKVAKHLMEELRLTEMFHFPGLLQGNGKLAAFSEADIFCFPTHYLAESFGVVLLEAMSMELPIVTTRWRGVPEVVEASGGAMLVEPRSPQLLADALEILLTNDDRRVAMGGMNRSYFEEHYTVYQYRANMELALTSLL